MPSAESLMVGSVARFAFSHPPAAILPKLALPAMEPLLSSCNAAERESDQRSRGLSVATPEPGLPPDGAMIQLLGVAVP